MLTNREMALCRLALTTVVSITGFIAAIVLDAPLWFIFVLIISHVAIWLVGLFEGGMSVPLCDKEHAGT